MLGHGTSKTIKIATLSLLKMAKYYNIGYTLAILKFRISTNRTLLGVRRPRVATSTQQSWLESQKLPSASSQQTKLIYQPLSSAIYNIGTNWCDLHFIYQGMGTYKLSSDWGSNKSSTNTVRCSIEGQALIPANKTSFRPLKAANPFKYWDRSWIVKFNIHSTGPF